jgi:hypothetical protein
MGTFTQIPDTEINVVFKDKEGDPMFRMTEPGQVPARHANEIHNELIRPYRIVNAVIEVRSSNPGVVVVHVEQDKAVVDTREQQDGETSLWARKCLVTLVDFRGKRVATTKYPNNNVRVLEMTEDKRLRIHVVSVSSQNGKLFVNMQTIVDTPVYQSEGSVVIPTNPDVTDKADTAGAVAEIFADWIGDLPDTTDIEEREPTPAPEADGEGVVLWYSLAMQGGAIRTAKGDARVHWTQVPERNGFRSLAFGERVRFGALVDADVKPEHRATAYQFEAKELSFA